MSRYLSKGLNSLFILVLFMIFCSCSVSKKGNSSSHSHRKDKTEYIKPDLHGLSHYRKMIVKEALEWIGTPYCYAMQDKGKGTDCSGLVLTVFQTVTGIKMPRNSAKQAEFCESIRLKDSKPGDLVFFATGKDPDRISHVGILINDNEFIHSSSSKGVIISRLDTPYYLRVLKKIGRMPDRN